MVGRPDQGKALGGILEGFCPTGLHPQPDQLLSQILCLWFQTTAIANVTIQFAP